MANGKKTDQVRIDAAERRQKALDLRKQGHSYREISTLLNISVGQAHADVSTAIKRLAELEQASADEYRTMEQARLDAYMLEADRILAATHPYVAGGKVLPDLADDGPRLRAIDRLLRISESRRKLLGIDKTIEEFEARLAALEAAYAAKL